jgi:hypothetical protein
MSETIISGFQSLAERTFEYHSHILTLFSGIIIVFLTNYLVTFMIPLPYWYGLTISFALLAISVYVFLLYSPQTSIGAAETVVPVTLHQFLHMHFDKLLSYIKLEWEHSAFHRNAVSAIGWMAPVGGVRVRIKQISSHQGKIELDYPFLRVFRCRFNISIFVTTITPIPEYRKVIIDIQMNRFVAICFQLYPNTACCT